MVFVELSSPIFSRRHFRIAQQFDNCIIAKSFTNHFAKDRMHYLQPRYDILLLNLLLWVCIKAKIYKDKTKSMQNLKTEITMMDFSKLTKLWLWRSSRKSSFGRHTFC